MLAVDAPFLQSKPYNNLLLQPLLGGGQMGGILQPLLGGGQVGGGLLGWRRNLHPIILPPLHRNPVLCRLARDNWGLNPFYIFLFLLHLLSLLNLSHLFHKLVLQGLKAVETDGGHVPVLHRDRSLCGLVLPQEGEVLKMGEHATGELEK